MSLKQVLTLVAFLCIWISSDAQRLPQTNLYLFDIEPAGDTAYVFSNPKFLSNFNRTGYNNQPYFMGPNILYLTSQLAEVDTFQSEILMLNIADETITRVTQTTESEFSPTMMPVVNMDDKASSFQFSAVRIESDQNKTQRLWQFPVDRSSKGEPAFPDVTNVGYYSWISARRCAIFIVGEPHKLVVADKRNTQVVDIAENVGRCIQKMPDGNIAYVDKSSGDWLIKRLDTRFYRSSLITATLPESEDFTVLKDGTIIMGKGSKLYKFHPRKDNSWRMIADLSYYNIDNISRLASTNGKLAVVSD